MESFATAYPVIFHDGEEEHDKGHIGLHSVLSFKKFQAQMSRIMGLPPNQLSTVFVCRRTLKDTTDKRQKLPINETTNFNIILNQHNPSRERDCHFLVSIKKSKKDRKGTGRKRNAEADNCEDEDSVSSRGDISPLEQRPKQQQQQQKDKPETEYPEAYSPTSILQRPLSPAISSPGDDVGVVGMLSQQQQQPRNPMASSNKVDRILLWRGEAGTDVVQPQRVEGFSVTVRSGTGQEGRSWGSDTPRHTILPAVPVVTSFAQQARQQQQQQQLPPSGICQPLPGSQRLAEALGRAPGQELPGTTAAATSWLSMLARSQQQQQQQVTRSSLPVQQQPEVLSSCCKQCLAGGSRSSFHHCVDDPVFEGFQGRRSPAGPVERPGPSVLA